MHLAVPLGRLFFIRGLLLHLPHTLFTAWLEKQASACRCGWQPSLHFALRALLHTVTEMPWRAVVGYAAAHLGRWHVDRGLLLRCLALYTIFNAVVNLVTRQGIYDKARRRPHTFCPSLFAVLHNNLHIRVLFVSP